MVEITNLKDNEQREGTKIPWDSIPTMTSKPSSVDYVFHGSHRASNRFEQSISINPASSSYCCSARTGLICGKNLTFSKEDVSNPQNTKKEENSQDF